MKNLGVILDKLSKNISRVKTVGVIILVILFLISLTQRGCDKEKMNGMVETLTGLNIENDILNNDIKERDSLLLAQENHISILNDSLKLSETRFRKLELEYIHLKGDFNDLSEKLILIPTDSSYSFLTKVAYPYRGKYEYLFNGPQVKGIHLTYMENVSLYKMNENLVAQKSKLNQQLIIQESLVKGGMEMYKNASKSRNDLQQIIKNKDEEISINATIAKKKKRKNFWSKTGIGALGILVGMLIGS